MQILKKLVEDIPGVSYYYDSSNVYKRRYYLASYQNKAKEVSRKIKYFALKDYGVEGALEKAIQHRKKLEEEYGDNPLRESTIESQKKNRKYINSYQLEKDYFILTIQHKEKMTKVKAKIDLKHYKKVKKYHWRLNSIKDNQKRIITTKNNRTLSLRDILFPNREGILNHKNRDKFDFRERYLYFTDSVQYVSARKFDKTNELIPGVQFYQHEGREYYVASFNRGNINKKERFNLDNFKTKEQAKERAIEQRNEWEEEYEEFGTILED